MDESWDNRRKKYFLMCFLGCLLHTFARMSLLLRNAVWARRTLARGLFGFGKANKQRQQIQEAQSGFFSDTLYIEMCSVFVDPLSKVDQAK